MAIADDFSVAVNGDIRYTGTTANYTVFDFHRFLQDLADNGSSSGNDLADITSLNPSDKSTSQIITLNVPYNIDDNAAEHLYEGSITQAGGDTVYSGLKVIGSVNSVSTELQIVQDGALITNYWGTGLNTGDGSLLRIMVKSRVGAVDIDGQRIRVQARELGDTYAEFIVTLGEGSAVAAIATNIDLNNQTAAGTIASWTSITVTEGLRNIDLSNGNGVREYLDEWNIGTQSLNDLYERAKWITRRGTSETIHGVNGELYRGITDSFAYDTEASGPFSTNEVISWSTGSGLLLAIDDEGSTGSLYMQLNVGAVPVNNDLITGGTSGATCLVNGAVTARALSPAFIGSSTGTNIIGAYGVGVEAADIGANDKLFDLTNTLQVPPNNQTFTVGNLINGEDRILVTSNDGADEVEYDQLTLNASLTSAAVTSIVMTAAIPTDTPTSGTIRVQTNAGIYKLVPFDSYTGSTFTVPAIDFSSDNATQPKNVFVSYLDKLADSTQVSYTAVYGSDRPLVVKVRNGTGVIPIVPFKTPATFSAAGGSVSTIRTSDV